MICTISNPPYNMKWEHPLIAQMQDRFIYTAVPPESNANLAFVLTALNESDRCIFILPYSVLSPKNKEEKEIMKYIVESNFLESIILCPDKMFESTNIPVCILVLDKHKNNSSIEMINMENKYEIEIREQNGQFGGNSHTNRTYKKEIKVFSDEIIDDALSCISERKNISKYCKCISIKEIQDNNYNLNPKRYIDFTEKKIIRREYKDIVNDLNRIIKEKNKCKLTINETIAKSLGFDINIYKKDHLQDKEFGLMINKIAGQKIEKHDYFRTTKNKNEIKFENNDKEEISSIFMMIFNMWKQHIYYLNIEENRYLAELRDALLPDLITGKIEL